MGKAALYMHTIRYLKPRQVWYQVLTKMGIACPLIKGYNPELHMEALRTFPTVRELDYDEEFLSRFSAEELMRNEITLLHQTESFVLDSSWNFPGRSPLWNHNLHYFEFLFALAKQFEESGNTRYLDKIKEYITAWIQRNTIGCKSSAWACYPIALRLPNWIEIYTLLYEEMKRDSVFEEALIKSLFEQYTYLLNHLEKHLLANHYFEDLKALIIASTFFGDEAVQKKASAELLKQCEEQILNDGMHYERSPMYQKIILEDLIRVEVALEAVHKANETIRQSIFKMLNAAAMLESGLDRLPLFNDCGKNVSKSLEALVNAAENHLGIKPEKKTCLPNGGFYAYELGKEKEWKLVIDAGQPGPDYSPGHSHCEMMSFELFHQGKPVLVNCGTYAYQCQQRKFFKSTKAHNTVQVTGAEQSECWSSFRMARRSRIRDVSAEERKIVICMTDYKKHVLKRTISVQTDSLEIVDESNGESLESYLHFADKSDIPMLHVRKGGIKRLTFPYAEEFGLQKEITAFRLYGQDSIRYTIQIESE